MISKIDSYASQTLDLVISQYRDSDLINGLVTKYTERLDGIEDRVFELLTMRMLDNAEGKQLDHLGEIVGEARKGRDDDLYRDILGLRIAINRSGGQPEIIMSTLDLLLNAEKIQYMPLYPGKFMTWVSGSALTARYLDYYALCHHSMENVSEGIVYDEKGLAPGTLSSTTNITQVEGMRGHCLYFAADDCYVTVTGSSSIDLNEYLNFTVQFDMIAENSSNMILAQKGDRLVIGHDSSADTLSFTVSDGANSARVDVSSPGIFDGDRHQVAMIIDRGNALLTAVIDGQSAGTADISSVGSLTHATDIVYGSGLIGYMDDFRGFTQALTIDDLLALYYADDEDYDFDLDETKETIDAIVPAGVGYFLIFSLNGHEPFVFDGDADGSGFSDVGMPYSGGAWTEVL